MDDPRHEFENFAPQEIMYYLLLYIFQALNPSPQLITKTMSQSLEPLQGNNFIAGKYGTNFDIRH